MSNLKNIREADIKPLYPQQEYGLTMSNQMPTWTQNSSNSDRTHDLDVVLKPDTHAQGSKQRDMPNGDACEDTMQNHAYSAPSSDRASAPVAMAPVCPPRAPKFSPPAKKTCHLVEIETSGDRSLPFDELKRDLELIDLLHEGRLVFPTQIKDTGPHMAPRKQLSFMVDRDLKTLYQRIYQLSDPSDQEDHAHTVKRILSCLNEVLELLVELEDSACPPLALSQDHVWFDQDKSMFEVWLVKPHTGDWAQAASALVAQSLLLFKDMSDKEMPSDHELLESLEVLNDTLSPRQVRALRLGLSGQLESCSELKDQLNDVEHDRSQVAHISNFERFVSQRVGQDKYRKRANQYLSLNEQQEDRFVESVFTFEGENFWLGAVFDGVSTCSFGSGAEIAEAARIGVMNGLRSIPDHRDRLVEGGNEAILDLMQRWVEKGVKERVEELSERDEVTLDAQQHMPTSTMTMALVSERGEVFIRWSGDSPVLVLNDRNVVMSLCHAHANKFDEHRLSRLPLEVALNVDGANHLTSDLSSLAFSMTDQVDHRSYQLREGETLILCSDGLIDGFKVHSEKLGGNKLGAEARALNRIEGWLEEHEPEDIYTLINGLCHQADMSRGVDNITVLGMKPQWVKKSKATQQKGSREDLYLSDRNEPSNPRGRRSRQRRSGSGVKR